MSIPMFTNSGQQGIYKIQIDEVIYVGKTTNFENRQRQHRHLLTSRKHHNGALQTAFDAHQSFAFEVLEVVPWVTKLSAREYEWAEKLDSVSKGKKK
jgi:predicted GIY-YIG superfamily endonuclease